VCLVVFAGSLLVVAVKMYGKSYPVISLKTLAVDGDPPALFLYEQMLCFFVIS
jgi:hypothetical protein